MQNQINEIEELYNRVPQQLITQFATQQEQHQLPHSQLQLSSDLDEEALNQLLRDLLESTDLPRFQFIVEGYILRGKLKSHILRYDITAEQTLNIQYIIAFPQLQSQSKAKNNDWVSQIGLLQGPEGVQAIAAALYNGSIALYSPQLKKMGTISADQDPLKSCVFLPAQTQNNYFCLSGGLGQLLQVHLVNPTQGKFQSHHISENKHEGSINSIAASPGVDSHVATGGSQGKLSIWQIPANFETAGSHNSLSKKKKKAELNLNILSLLASQPIHKGTIESLKWQNNQQVVSSSSAHQIAITNVTKLARSDTILTRDSVVVSVDVAGSQILSAHEDGQIRLWDIRETSRPTNTFKSHAKWVSSVRFASSSHIFGSGSYDRTVKLWDQRCSFPLQNIQSHEEKVLAIEWLSSKSLVSGGSDSSVHLYGAA